MPDNVWTLIAVVTVMGIVFRLCVQSEKQFPLRKVNRSGMNSVRDSTDRISTSGRAHKSNRKLWKYTGSRLGSKYSTTFPQMRQQNTKRTLRRKLRPFTNRLNLRIVRPPILTVPLLTRNREKPQTQRTMAPSLSPTIQRVNLRSCQTNALQACALMIETV